MIIFVLLAYLHLIAHEERTRGFQATDVCGEFGLEIAASRLPRSQVERLRSRARIELSMDCEAAEESFSALTIVGGSMANGFRLRWSRGLHGRENRARKD